MNKFPAMLAAATLLGGLSAMDYEPREPRYARARLTTELGNHRRKRAKRNRTARASRKANRK